MNVSQLLEAIDQWRSGDIVEFANTVRASSETPKNRCDSCWDKPSSSTNICENLCLVRTAKMMDASGQNNNERAAETSGVCARLNEMFGFKWLRSLCRNDNQVDHERNVQNEESNAPERSVPTPKNLPPTTGTHLRSGKKPKQEIPPRSGTPHPHVPNEFSGTTQESSSLPIPPNTDRSEQSGTSKEEETNQPGPSQNSSHEKDDMSRTPSPSESGPSGTKPSSTGKERNIPGTRETKCSYDPNYMNENTSNPSTSHWKASVSVENTDAHSEDEDTLGRFRDFYDEKYLFAWM